MGQVSSRECTRGNYTLMFLSLSPSLRSSLKINKIFFKRIEFKFSRQHYLLILKPGHILFCTSENQFCTYTFPKTNVHRIQLTCALQTPSVCTDFSGPAKNKCPFLGFGTFPIFASLQVDNGTLSASLPAALFNPPCNLFRPPLGPGTVCPCCSHDLPTLLSPPQ